MPHPIRKIRVVLTRLCVLSFTFHHSLPRHFPFQPLTFSTRRPTYNSPHVLHQQKQQYLLGSHGTGTRANRARTGDTVNTASRMESTSLPGRVQCTRRAASVLAEQDPAVPQTRRGHIQVKGKVHFMSSQSSPRSRFMPLLWLVHSRTPSLLLHRDLMTNAFSSQQPRAYL